MPSFCAVLNCSDKYGHAESISFHKFPFKRKELLVSWLEFAQRGKDWQPSKWSAICSRHFREQDFNCVNERKTLKKTACPSVRLDQAVPLQDQKQQKEPMRKVIKPKNSKVINEKTALEENVQNIPDVDENINESAEEQTAASPSHSPLSKSKVNCRLCGNASSAVVTFSANFEIYGMIQKCFPTLNIQQDDNLPKEVCRICLKRLESFSCYIDKVLETQSELQRQFCTPERNQKSAASERQLKIKQEPVVRVKQEVAEGGGSFLSDDMEMGLDDLGGEQEHDDSVVDQKYQFCDFPLLNSQDIINNCDIMEIINLDDPFIDIPDDDGNTTCADACLPTPTLLPAHRQVDHARLPSAHELLQTHLLIEEHNYAYAAEDFKEEWQIKNNYKTEKLDDYEQENAEELGHADAEEYAAEDNAPSDTAPPNASDATNSEQGNVRQSTQEPGDNRSTKPIVTSVSDIQMETRSPTASTVRGKDPHAKPKPNIVVLNESIVKSSSAFQLHACTVCQSKFFSVDSLSQHYAMQHQQQQQQVPVNNQQQQQQHESQPHHQQMQHDVQQHFQQQQHNHHQQQQQQYLQPKNEPHLLPNTHHQLQQQQHDKQQQQQQQYQLHHTQQQPLPMVSVPSGNILAVEANEQQQHQQQSYKGDEKSAEKNLPRRDSILTDVSSGNHKMQYTQPPPLAEAEFSQLQSWQQPVRSYAPPQLLQQTSYQQPLNILDMQQSYARQQTPCYGAPQTLVQNYYNAPQPRPQLQYCPEPNKQPTALLPGNYAHGLGLDGGALQMRLAAHEVVFKAPRPVATMLQHKRQAKLHKFVAEAASLRTAPRRHTTRASLEHVLAYYRQLRCRYRQLQRKCRNLQQNVHQHSTPTPPPLQSTTTTPQPTAAELRLQCRICRQRYANIAQLLRHRQTAPMHHVRKPSRFFASCFGCERFFCSRLALRNHMRYICQTLPLRWFKTQMQSFKCRYCRSITFTHWRLYRRHELKCQLKQRQWQWQRRAHSELPLQSTCQWPRVAHRQQQHSPKVCYGNSDCTCKVGCQHSRCTHAAKRKLRIHRCALCPCIFKRRSALRQHMLGFHLQLKPYVCAVCKRRFALKCDMLRCVQAHAGKRSFAATAQRISCSRS